MKFIKKLITLATVSSIAYFGFKVFKMIKSSNKLSNTLPDFLKNIYGERPEMRKDFTFFSMNIKLSFSKETLDKKEQEIEDSVMEYIEDFYPILTKLSLDVEVVEREDSNEDSEEEIKDEEIVEEDVKDEEVAEEVAEEDVKDEE